MAKSVIFDVRDGDMPMSGYIDDEFKIAYRSLKENGLNVSSAREIAIFRLREKPFSEVNFKGSIIREGVVYVPGKGVYLTRVSPYFEEDGSKLRPTVADSLNQEQTERALADSVHVPYGLNSIPVKDFPYNSVTRFLFDETTSLYGNFLENLGINEINLVFANQGFVDGHERPFASPLNLQGLEYKSAIWDDTSAFEGRARLRGTIPEETMKKVINRVILEERRLSILGTIPKA